MQIVHQEILNRFLWLLKTKNVESHAISVYQGGERILEKAFSPFVLEALHPLYSVSKSFTSMAIGFLEEEGKLSIEDIWLDYFPEYHELVVDNTFFRVKIRHLLTMSLGQDSEIEITKEDDWVTTVLGKTIVYEPGSMFLYNSYCSHMLSALVSKLTGLPMAEYLKPRLFDPLGITHYYWERDLKGRTLGGYGLHLTIHDLTTFGICCLHQGIYDGKQILPAEWLMKATNFQMANANEYPVNRSENRQGYGLHFWMCTHKGFRCSGLHGQLCFMQPENDLVIAMQNATTGSQVLLDCWFEALGQKKLLESPGFEIDMLNGRKESLCLVPNLNKKLQAYENYFQINSLKITEADSILSLEIVRADVAYKISAGFQFWNKQPDTFHDFNSFMTQEGIMKEYDEKSHVAFANYAWKTKTTLVVEIREWDHSCGTTLTFEFDNSHVVMRYAVNGLYTMITETKCLFKI